MLIVLRKNYIALITCAVVVVVTAVSFLDWSEPVSTVPVSWDTFVLDAGHGGMDGGASGTSGVLEKDINLKVTMYLKEKLEEAGKTVILTRDSDTSLHTTNSNKVRTQKRSDLEQRKKILNENPKAAFISIHMNKFENSKPRGAQVFYADNESSRLLGERVQKSLIEGLADGNTRLAKTIPSNVYVFKNVKTTAIVIECGFLSNPEEEKLLAEDEYQRRLARYICNALI